MARIMIEEWPADESVESFVLRRFANDTMANFETAIAIFSEMEDADARFEELKPWRPR